MPGSEHGVQPHLTQILTRDAEEHRAWMSSRYNNHDRRVQPRGRGFVYFAEFGTLGRLTYNHTRYTAAAAEIDCPATPTAYLRRVRLARAHDDLLAAEPGDGTTVTAVAARWGYARPHRFAAAYRQVYGRAPGEVLRS